MTLPPPPDRWTIELANTERAEAIAAFGFTARQAGFLLQVLLHSGVFLERHYVEFLIMRSVIDQASSEDEIRQAVSVAA